MKTAMQEMIEDLKAAKDRVEPSNDYARGMIGATELSIIRATELLEKEKEQIRKAYMEGKWHEGSGTLSEINMTGEDYYNQTYPKTNPIDNTKNLNHG